MTHTCHMYATKGVHVRTQDTISYTSSIANHSGRTLYFDVHAYMWRRRPAVTDGQPRESLRDVVRIALLEAPGINTERRALVFRFTISHQTRFRLPISYRNQFHLWILYLTRFRLSISYRTRLDRYRIVPYLPREEADHAEVDGHVRGPSRVVPLLHLGHEGRRHRPRDHDARAGVQVCPREELLRAQEGVNRPFDRREGAESQEKGAHVVVTVAYLQTTQNMQVTGCYIYGVHILRMVVK